MNLTERKKHATGKAKKLKKAIHEVIFTSYQLIAQLILSQDQKSKDEAVRFVETNIEKMEKERKKLADLEESLSSEEKVMEEIRDSLKGTASPRQPTGNILNHPTRQNASLP